MYQTRTHPYAESLTGEPRCLDESLCSSTDRPLGRNFPLCDLRTLGSTTPPLTLAILQPLESPSDQRVAIGLDVAQADFGVGGLVVLQPATALQFLPVSDLGTLRPITSSSAPTPPQPLESPSDPRFTIDLDVTQADFGIGGLCSSISAATPRVLPVRSDALSSGPAAANGAQLPSRIFSPPPTWPRSFE